MKFINKYDLTNSWYTISGNYVAIIVESNNNSKANLIVHEVNNKDRFNKEISFSKGYVTIVDYSIYYFDESLNYIKINLLDRLEKEVLNYAGNFIIHPKGGNYIVSEFHKFDNNNQKGNPGLKSIFINDKKVWEKRIFGDIQILGTDLIICFNDDNIEILSRKNNQFSRLSFETGEKLWDFDLERHRAKIISAYPYTDMFEPENASTDVKVPIGVYKDQLWFSMSHYGLLCLNYHTGEFMHYLRDCHQNDIRYGGLPYGNYPVIPYTENAVILESEGKMVCFDGMYYWELNLETLVLDFHYLQNYFQEVNCSTYLARSKKLIVEADNIYMVDNKNKKFACFSRSKLKYNWIESVPEGSGAPRAIEKHGNRLYIDTTKKQLLVYELDGDE